MTTKVKDDTSTPPPADDTITPPPGDDGDDGGGPPPPADGDGDDLDLDAIIGERVDAILAARDKASGAASHDASGADGGGGDTDGRTVAPAAAAQDLDDRIKAAMEKLLTERDADAEHRGMHERLEQLVSATPAERTSVGQFIWGKRGAKR